MLNKKTNSEDVRVEKISFFLFYLSSVLCFLYFSGTAHTSIDNGSSNVDSKTIIGSQSAISSESDVGNSSSVNINTVSDSISHNIATIKDPAASLKDPIASDETTVNSPEMKLTQAERSASTSEETTAAQSASILTSTTGTGNVVSNTSVLSEETVKPVQITPAGNTGSATASIPIIVPPGRKGIGPKLSLNYNSNTRNSLLGVGWGFDMGAIQRSTKRGVNYNANDYVVAVNGSASELVPRGDWGSNYYGAKIEGSFSKYYKNLSTGGWEITAKDGTKYYYGTTVSSRQDSALGVFKWCLNKVQDTNGNYMTITYWKDQGEIYLDRIDYTGNTAGLNTTNYVKFYLESRTDAPVMYKTGASVKTAYRLKTIEVYGNGQLAKEYDLQYLYSSNSGRSLLSSVTEFGSGENEFLSTTFIYSSSSNSFSYGIWSRNNFGISPYTSFRTGDFNGDGKIDTAFSFFFDHDQCRNDCQQNCEPDCTYTCENSCENSCQDSHNSCNFDCYNICDNYCEDQCTDDVICDNVCQDANDYDLCYDDCMSNPDQYDCINDCEDYCEGSCQDSCWDAYQSCEDSCADICEDPCRQTCDDSCDQTCWDSCGNYCYYYGAEDNTWVGISGNNNLTYGSWHQNGLNVDTYIPLIGDFNGDGRSDIAFYDNRTWVGISNGNGFNFSIWSQSSFGVAPYNAIAVGDFNGDGLSDVVFYYEDGNTWVGISTGSSFNYSIWSNNGFGTQPYKTLRVGDFNGDGLSDVAFYYEDGNTWMGLSNGSSFTYSVWSHNFFGTQPYETFSAGDFNGDGLSDVVFYYEDGNTWVGISTGNSFYYSVWSNNGFGTKPYTTFRVDDFNGDDKSDIVFYYEDSNTWVGASNGMNFTYSIWSQNSFGTKPYETFGTGDLNGDGKSDVVFYYEDGNTYGGLSGQSSVNSIPDLLNSISTSIGGTTTIEYKSSSAYTNTLLPFTVQTLSSVTIYDGLGTLSLKTYDYDGGYYEAQEKEFRGFQYIKATAANGTTTETWFKQDSIFKGLPEEQITRGSSGNIYTRTYNTFLSTSPYTGVNFPYLSQKDDYVYDGTSTAKQAATSFTYDSYGNITKKYLHGDLSLTGDERDEYTEYTYNTTSWIVALPSHTYLKDSGGTTRAQAWYTYDTKGNLLTKTDWLNGGTNPVTTYTYDSYGNAATVRDPRNNTTTITYDTTTSTYPVTVQNPLGHTAQKTYDYKFGKVLTETDPNNNTTTYQYDVFGRTRKVTNPAPYGVTEYFYNNFGDIDNQHVREETQDRSGNIMKWKETYFDGLGRIISENFGGPGARIIIVNTEYNNNGLVFKKSNPYYDGDTIYKTTYTYDPVDRVVYTLNPDSTSSSIIYDKGWTTYIDGNSHRKDVQKDIYAQTVTVDEYTGAGTAEKPYALYATTTYEYNVSGNLEKLTDANGNVTTVAYDSLSRKDIMFAPDMGYWTYEYDANNNLTAQTDASLQIIEFEYDALNRVTKKNYPDGSYIEYSHDEPFSSNSTGRLTTVTDVDSLGVTKLTTKTYYDETGQISRADKIIDSVSYTAQTYYDALGRVKRIIYPDGSDVDYSYDSHSNIKDIKSGLQTYIYYSNYVASGQPEDVDYGNGINTLYQYYPANNHLFSVTTTTPTDILLNNEYYYDYSGNIIKIIDILDSSKTSDYKYDDLDRLLEADSPSYNGKLIYQYDKIGNMTYNCRYGYYEYDYPSQPHAVKRIVKNGQVIDTYTYDNNGNMISGAGRILTYDYDDRPTSIEYNGNAVISVYDSDGQRAKKVTPNSTTIYIGNLYECTNGLCTKHIMADGQIITSIKGSDIYYYHTDHLGSSSVMTDFTGNRVEDIYYYPYGEIKTNTGTIDVKHKFTGKEYDADTGLYYYGARYYDPRLARFISADTIVPDYTDPQSLNRYSYVLNNPLNLIDPSGNYYEETEKGYQEYVGPSTEANADRDLHLAELYYGSGMNFDFSGLSFIPILRMEHERYLSIINNTPAIFPILDNPNVSATPPWYKLGIMSDVDKYDSYIKNSADVYKVDPDLVRSIMYLETTHGYYDTLKAIFDRNSSILPMNVQTPRWDALGTNRAALKNPESNIDIGVKLISRIQERILDPNPAKVGTLYHSLSQEQVDKYGSRLNYYYSAKPWSY